MPNAIRYQSVSPRPENPSGADRAASKLPRVLIVLNSICLYGLERAVIETFGSLRHLLDPCILIPQATRRYPYMGSLAEIRHWQLPHCFFSDDTDWPRIGKPRSLGAAWRIISSIFRANLDVLRSARHYDWLYVPTVSGLYFSFAAMLWFRLTGRKVIYTFHDLTLKKSLVLRLGTLFVSDLMHSSEHSFQAVNALNPWIAKKTNHVIPPTVVIHGRAGGAHPVRFAEGRRLLYVGQVAKHKGIDMLLEAFRRIAPEFPDAGLDIVGGADWEYGGDFTKCLDDPLFAGRVKHWGYVADVEPFFRSSYIYIQPTLPSVCHESFGRGAVEALCAGVPVVCFRSGALMDIVQHRITGLICETETPECLAAALRELLAHPEERERYGSQGRVRFEEKYSVEIINQRWAQLIGGRGQSSCAAV